jgi:hypothetical protein
MASRMLAFFGIGGRGVLLIAAALVIGWAVRSGPIVRPKSMDKKRLVLFTVAAMIASAPLWILGGHTFVAVAPFLSPAQCTALKILALPAGFALAIAYGGALPSPVVLAAIPLINGLIWGLLIERLVSALWERESPR